MIKLKFPKAMDKRFLERESKDTKRQEGMSSINRNVAISAGVDGVLVSLKADYNLDATMR